MINESIKISFTRIEKSFKNTAINIVYMIFVNIRNI